MKKKKKSVPDLDSNEIKNLYESAKKNYRKRYPKILHSHGDYLNKVFNFLIAGTYMQPHLHPSEEKIEKMTVIEGEICVLFFNNVGQIIKKNYLNSKHKKNLSVPAFSWHTYIVTSSKARRLS